jgi:hypothetical protein
VTLTGGVALPISFLIAAAPSLRRRRLARLYQP